MNQPTPISYPILTQIEHDFTPEQRGQVWQLLAHYGERAHEREAERVRLAILALAHGDVSQVAQYVRSAKWNYRDVLWWADTLTSAN